MWHYYRKTDSKEIPCASSVWETFCLKSARGGLETSAASGTQEWKNLNKKRQEKQKKSWKLWSSDGDSLIFYKLISCIAFGSWLNHRVPSYLLFTFVPRGHPSPHLGNGTLRPSPAGPSHPAPQCRPIQLPLPACVRLGLAKSSPNTPLCLPRFREKLKMFEHHKLVQCPVI